MMMTRIRRRATEFFQVLGYSSISERKSLAPAKQQQSTI
jgi:hypothetical protein